MRPKSNACSLFKNTTHGSWPQRRSTAHKKVKAVNQKLFFRWESDYNFGKIFVRIATQANGFSVSKPAFAWMEYGGGLQQMTHALRGTYIKRRKQGALPLKQARNQYTRHNYAKTSRAYVNHFVHKPTLRATVWFHLFYILVYCLFKAEH
jgi:hypothetical protein